MARIDELAKDFLAQPRIAVAGVTRSREDAANLLYRKFKKAGKQVFAINPNTDTFDGDPCYPNLKALPGPVDGVLIVTKPANSEKIVQECVELGIKRVWMHCMFGTSPKIGKDMAAKIGSASPEAVRLCKENGIAVIPGACPNMFFEADFGHKCMLGMFRLVGNMSVE